MNKPDITDCLQIGAENAIKVNDLAAIRSEDPRDTRAAIYDARCRGAVILSTSEKYNGGYFLPKNNDEIRRYIAFQKSRIHSAREAMKSAVNFLKSGGITDDR